MVFNFGRCYNLKSNNVYMYHADKTQVEIKRSLQGKCKRLSHITIFA